MLPVNMPGGDGIEWVKDLMDGLAGTPPEVLPYLQELQRLQGVHP